MSAIGGKKPEKNPKLQGMRATKKYKKNKLDLKEICQEWPQVQAKTEVSPSKELTSSGR